MLTDQPVYNSGRTYNQTASRTMGDHVPAVVASQGLTTGQTGIIPQLKKNTAFRTNVGISNLGTTTVVATVTLFGATGAQIGTARTLTAEAGHYYQQDDIFGTTTVDIAYATVQVQTTGGRVWAYGSVIDAVTGDPTNVPVLQ